MSKSFRFLFLSLFSIYIFGSSFEGLYKVKMFPYSGSTEIYSSIEGETLFVEFKTKAALNTVKINNNAKLLLSPLKVVSISSDYNKLGVKSSGHLLFSDTLIETYFSDAKTKNKSYTVKNQPNDWLILPFFLRHYDKDRYICSMIHGDFIIDRKANDSTVEWSSTDKSIKVVFRDSAFIYLKAGKIEMTKVKN